MVLSDFMSHVGLCVADAKLRKIHVEVTIDHFAGGGIYVALCSAATIVKAREDSKISLLPEDVVSTILGSKKGFMKSWPDNFLTSMVADELVRS